MAIETEITFNFECINCPKYVKPNKKGYMGFCPIENKKVKKDYSCPANPALVRCWFFMYGIPLEQTKDVPDDELREMKAKILEEVDGVV